MSRRARDPLELVSLRQLRYFNAVIRADSFGKAASECSISQPALSEQIAAFESALGLRLFDRVGRRAIPTQQALQLHRRITATMGDLQAALRAASDRSAAVSGTVRIGLVQSYGSCWVAPVVRAAQARWPDLSISMSRRTVSALAEGVARGDLDFAVTFDASDRPDMDVQPCFAEPYVAVRSGRRRRPMALAELAGEPLALLPPEYAMRRRIDSLFAAQGLRPQVRFESDAQEDLVHAARHRGMTAVVNAATALSLDVRGAVAIDDPTLARTACLIRSLNRYHTHAAVCLWNAMHAAADGLAARIKAGLPG
ncbi:LysR substrate-binding domain-containing protein [Variovorax sp. VRV01]|uniref:LysR substrate-binding domain-containing protein n=1 Tax=Variovorax sp. VRV01 TaxID=2769259 RepID=UPI001CE1CFD3|nr:LysR substrate-binding domain-containing protein [Variovorax sp. VRV01]